MDIIAEEIAQQYYEETLEGAVCMSTENIFDYLIKSCPTCVNGKEFLGFPCPIREALIRIIMDRIES